MCQLLRLANTNKSYPGDSCVENQTATGLQNQHGIDVLRTKDLLLNTTNKQQYLQKDLNKKILWSNVLTCCSLVC